MASFERYLNVRANPKSEEEYSLILFEVAGLISVSYS